MKVKDLILQLQRFDPELEAMILDGFNSGGHPREINFGPHIGGVTEADIESTCDCEDMDRGTPIVLIGFGSY